MPLELSDDHAFFKSWIIFDPFSRLHTGTKHAILEVILLKIFTSNDAHTKYWDSSKN